VLLKVHVMLLQVAQMINLIVMVTVQNVSQVVTTVMVLQSMVMLDGVLTAQTVQMKI
jgi:hypothetical protein